MTGQRITGSVTELNDDAIAAFFAKRAERARSAEALTSVLYQDNHPELAVARDQAEKTRLLPMLELHPGTRVLDIACGIGRWAQPITESGASYVGVDFAAGLLDAAREANPGLHFEQRDIKQLTAADITDLGNPERVLIIGALIYLNDDALPRLGAAVAAGSAPIARVVLREPTGVEARLTLDQIHSGELQQIYSAVYRTADELIDLFGSPLAEAGFTMQLSSDLYEGALNNRAETRQRVYVWDRR